MAERVGRSGVVIKGKSQVTSMDNAEVLGKLFHALATLCAMIDLQYCGCKTPSKLSLLPREFRNCRRFLFLLTSGAAGDTSAIQTDLVTLPKQIQEKGIIFSSPVRMSVWVPLQLRRSEEVEESGAKYAIPRNLYHWLNKLCAYGKGSTGTLSLLELT